MKHHFWLFTREGVYYLQDARTRRKESLHTTDPNVAQRLRAAREEALHQPTLNYALGRAYLSANDPSLVSRTWEMVMDRFCAIGKESTQLRKRRELERSIYDALRTRKVVETCADDFFFVLNRGSASTVHFLRCLHNLARGLGWLPWEVVPGKLWPVTQPAPKRGITWGEHQLILASEQNRERRAFYGILWEVGAAQSDAARLSAETIDWAESTLSYQRSKTSQWCHLRIGRQLEELLRGLPAQGPLFPHLSTLSANDRAAEFYRRCKLLGIRGISLHSYRYAWAERARSAGYPERSAQEALGHNSKAVHRAYAKKAHVKIPSLQEYELASRQTDSGLDGRVYPPC